MSGASSDELAEKQNKLEKIQEIFSLNPAVQIELLECLKDCFEKVLDLLNIQTIKTNVCFLLGRRI